MCVQPILAEQASLVHGLPSSQSGARPGAQKPDLQLSPCVHKLPSASHKMPSCFQVTTHLAVLGSQPLLAQAVLPLVSQLMTVVGFILQPGAGPCLSQYNTPLQGFPSSYCKQSSVVLHAQTLELPLHLPPWQVSPNVQSSPSLQLKPLLGAWLQPNLLSQSSLVQTFPSTHVVGSMAMPTHFFPLQLSSTVQASLSSQGPLATWCKQPILASQTSTVQLFKSSQRPRMPAHLPPLQLSSVVQGLPSLQAAPSLGAPTHLPLPASHAEVTHGSALAHALGPPATHDPPLHASPSVHGLPSASHGVPSAGKWMQP